MAKLNLQQCIDKIKEEYPESYPYAFVLIEGKYVFDLVNKGEKPENHIIDMHVVDPETGDITGGISIMEFLKDAGFREKWKKPNLVSDHDKSLTHSNLSYRSNQNSWGVTLKDDENYLIHYGILGQKWGVRRFQNEDGSYTEEGKLRYNSVRGSKKDVHSVSGHGGTFGLSKKEDLAIDTAMLTVPILAFLSVQAYNAVNKAYHSSKLYDRKRQNEINEKNLAISKEFLSDIADVGKDFSKDKMPRKIQGEHSVEDDMAAVNPRYDNGVIPKTRNNDALCSVTYDLRRRGYDVTALASEGETLLRGVLEEKIYKNPKIDKIKVSTWEDYEDEMINMYPEGSRGLLKTHTYAADDNGITSFSWEIRNGKVELLAPQTNSKITYEDFYECNMYPYNGNECIRLDNLELKPSGIKLASAELRPGWKDTINTERKQYNENHKNDRHFRKRPMIADKSKSKNTLTDSQRRKNYEETYLRNHPNASKEAIDNYVNQQLRGGR